ncbi:hypothetical protein [Rhabdothermincola salaria]|uniref:hypothetical protein n=1 Tax=Rhabdothermincola salaria TaxID=2903142 RepID=UPI001E4E5808|nr:hypothetical protein [Rhabdothermincola salaria]MCD9623699.1 hypothetical protein [Rhabdothermincola salaria]
MSPEDHPEPADADEVIAVVADHEEARPLVESLLLAGLGPSLRDVSAGVEVTVVAGQGRRARQVLGLPDAEPVDPSPAPPRRPLGGVLGSPAAAAPTDGPPVRDRASTLRALVIFAVALVVIPAVAFYISFKVAGG